MNYDITNAVKNRIDTINTKTQNATNAVPNPADAARKAADATKEKAVEVATGISVKAYETFMSAFEEATAAVFHYGGMTLRRFIEAGRGMSAGLDSMEAALRANDPATAAKAATSSGLHWLDASIEISIGNALAAPISKMLEAGMAILGGSLTMATVADLVVPLVFIIAVGYASMKVKELAQSKFADMIEDAFDRFETLEQTISSTDDDDESTPSDEDVEVIVDLEDEDSPLAEQVREALENVDADGEEPEHVARSYA